MPNPNHEIDFWAYVRPGTGCWEWIGSGRSQRYGAFKYQGRAIKAHRFSWILANGAIPDGMHVLHRCDHTKCVNPSHLFIGTHKDNMSDRDAKGRGNQPRGARSGHAKLTNENVVEIRRLYTRGSIRQIDLAQRFNIHQTGISKIILGKSWSHI